MKVYVAIHHDGYADVTETVRAFTTREQAIKWKADIARKDWPVSNLGEIPDDQDVLIDTYWDYMDCHGFAWFFWDECEVEYG